MPSKKLTCFLFNDLEPWERAGVEPIIENLCEYAIIETIWVTESQRRFFKIKPQGDFWIVARDWQRALDFLAAKYYSSGKIFVSILHSKSEEKKMYGLSFKSIFSPLGKAITLIVYSPLEYRFFKEIKKIPEAQLKLSSLAIGKTKPQINQTSSTGKFQVGTFCDFSTESNINFLIGISHFITNQTSQVHFNILGRGPLYSHFSKMLIELELDHRVSIIETVSESTVGALDLFIYAPLRNHHFIPVLIAGAYKVPVISIDVPGIEEFIITGESGIVMPSNDIKLMGEKIIQMLHSKEMRQTMGAKLQTHIENIASPSTVSRSYRDLFFQESEKDLPIELAA